MTTHELARKLLIGPDVMVTISGYESGVNEIITIMEPRMLSLNTSSDWWNGSHTYDYPDEGNRHKKVLAIHLSA